MEVIHCNEVFALHKGDEDFNFDHTKIILRGQQGQYYYAKSPQRIPTPSEVNIDELELQAIPIEHIFPPYLETLTRVPNSLLSSCYIKRPSLIYYDDISEQSRQLGVDVAKEIEFCEILKQSPHPNIVEYLGCLLEGDGRIHGLCFSLCPLNLEQFLRQHPGSNNTQKCLNGIRKGMQHLHKLGLIHNDLKPENIMTRDGEPIIIDFDSCAYEGDMLGSKAGSEGWELEGAVKAERENDFYSLQQIEKWLHQFE